MKDDHTLEHVADRLRSLMKQKGLNQAEVARAAGLSPAAVNQFLGGQRTPSSRALVRLAAALDVSVDFLVGKGNDSDLRDLLRHRNAQVLFRKLTALSLNDRKTIEAVLDGLLKKKQDKG